MFNLRSFFFGPRAAALLVLLAAGLTWSLSTSPILSGVALLVVVACLAVLVVTFTFRGRPPQTVAEVLYDAEQLPPDAGARLKVPAVSSADRS